MKSLIFTAFSSLLGLSYAYPAPSNAESLGVSTNISVDTGSFFPPPGAPCFPALGFQTPPNVPNHLNGWWCDPVTEHAFLGFSYEVTACQNISTLRKEFADIRYHFNSRYIRLYGVCDNDGFYDDIVEAAWENNLGVHALIWFGFDGTDQWIGRRDTLFATLHTNPKAKFVTRVVQFGSEPLFDNVLPHQQLAEQVVLAKQNLSSLHINVTVSELAYGYQERGGAEDVLTAIDSINAHMLPFFAQNASTAFNSWPSVLDDMDWFVNNGQGKKIYFDENGWPSVTSPSVQNNSIYAVADVQQEQDYFLLLESKCEYLRDNAPVGGVGWFAHIYSDNMEPGYGIYNTSGQMKFPFNPKSYC